MPRPADEISARPPRTAQRIHERPRPHIAAAGAREGLLLVFENAKER